MNLTHAIIIRLYFEPEDPRAAWRLAFFEAMALPCLQRQSCPDFSLWINCHPAHQARLEAMDPRIRTFQDQRRHEDTRIGLNIPAPDGQELPRVDIQTRHDSDDLVSRHYVSRIRKEILARPEAPLIISFQPYKLDLATLQRYRMGKRYHPKSCSMFSSLYQPPAWEPYMHIYDYNHLHLWEAGPKVMTVREGYCDLVIHGGNVVTTIQPGRDILL